MVDVNSHEVFEAGDIIKYGYMRIKRPPSSTKVRIKAWQSKFFVLRDKTHNSAQRLEYYKDETAFGFQKSVEYSFGLDRIAFIGKTQSSKANSYPIMVVCSKQGALTLACDTEQARKDWLLMLNRVSIKEGGTNSSDMWANVTVDVSPVSTPELPRQLSTRLSTLHSKSHSESADVSPGATCKAAGYFVTTRLTPHSEQNNIRGDFLMCISDGEVLLKSAIERSQTVVSWAVADLRAFKSEPAVNVAAKDMHLLTLQVGRRTSTGEGIFQFLTKHGDTIADEIRHHSRYVVKSAAEKREAFRRSSTNSQSRSPPSLGSPKKLSKMMTAPTGRIASVLKRDNSLATEIARKRADTDPFVGQGLDENGAAEQSVREEDVVSRSRSATESSVEKTSDDDVFVTRRAYSEIDANNGVSEESEISPYIDLLSDENAEPIHISDPVPPSRKTSTDSFTSTSSFGSEEGSMRSANSLSRTFPNTQLIPEENEMDSEGYVRSEVLQESIRTDNSFSRTFTNVQQITEENEIDSEGYIKCEALQPGPTESGLDGNGNVLECFVSEKWTDNQMGETSGNHSLQGSPVDAHSAKSNSPELSLATARVSQKTRENLFSELNDANCGEIQPKSKLEKEEAVKSENVLPPKTKPESDALRAPFNFDTSNPELMKNMYEKLVAQMEKPQENDVNLFPSPRCKRNSIGPVSVETVREVQQTSVTSVKGKVTHLSLKKHSVIEKSNSHSEGFGLRPPFPGPPPLPVRPTSSEVIRRRSTTEISEELQKRPELAAAHRSTFFAKGMGNVDPLIFRTPIKSNINSSHLSGEAAIQARLIEKTEMRDELAQCATNLAPGSELPTCSTSHGGSHDDLFTTNSDPSEKSLWKSTENLEDDGLKDMKRKDSKASKLVKKVWKHARKPRRGSNESRGEASEELPEKCRRDSLSPGDVMDVQGRFSGSEPSTPEMSPQMSRKSSKSSPKASRKTSREEKVKKDKESPDTTAKFSPASKILRKISKGSDARKDEPTAKKVSKEDWLEKEGFTADQTAKQTASASLSSTSTNKQKQRKLGNVEHVQTDLKNDTCRSNQSINERTEASCPIDGLDRDTIDIECPQTIDDHAPAPALPPRKKFNPPPLPPRLLKSPSNSSCTATAHMSTPLPNGRTQPVAPSAREGRRHSGSRSMSSSVKEEFLPPPPVPPRRENAQSPDPKKMMSNGRTSARAPVIQLTCSSSENKDDCFEKYNSADSEEGMVNSPNDKAPDQNPPTMSAAHQVHDSLSQPVPLRPPKGEQKAQAREFFRSRANQQVCIPSSDSESLEMDAPDQGEDRSKDSSAQQPSQPNHMVGLSPGPVSSGKICVMRTQREAMRLKINLMKETSVDDDDAPFESDDSGITSVIGENFEGQIAPKSNCPRPNRLSGELDAKMHMAASTAACAAHTNCVACEILAMLVCWRPDMLQSTDPARTQGSRDTLRVQVSCSHSDPGLASDDRVHNCVTAQCRCSESTKGTGWNPNLLRPVPTGVTPSWGVHSQRSHPSSRRTDGSSSLSSGDETHAGMPRRRCSGESCAWTKADPSQNVLLKEGMLRACCEGDGSICASAGQKVASSELRCSSSPEGGHLP